MPRRYRLPLLYVCFLFLLTAAGCVSQKKLPYLQGRSFSTKAPVAVENAPPSYQLQAGDVLSIKVQSSQPGLSELFNLTGAQAAFSGDPGVLYLTGYPVDETGSITLPTLGKVKVTGMTLEKAQRTIQDQVARYVRDANVLVKLLSFKITVLGEVRVPGRYFIYNPQATVLEALGMAGDLTEFGNRQNIKLVRQTAKGPTVVLIDLTDPALLSSPYFYLLPNDALYVEPLKARTDRGNAANLGIIFSGISAIVLLLNFVLVRR